MDYKITRKTENRSNSDVVMAKGTTITMDGQKDK